MSKPTEEQLSVVWNADYERHRFIPKAFSNRGHGWGVWDRRERRFLEDREVARLSTEKLGELYAD